MDALAGPGRLRAAHSARGGVGGAADRVHPTWPACCWREALARQREMAVRRHWALDEDRLVRQLLTGECCSSPGRGAAGLPLADWLARLPVKRGGRLRNRRSPDLDATRTDGLVLPFIRIPGFASSPGVVVRRRSAALSSASPDLSNAMREGSGAPLPARGVHASDGY